MFSFTTPDNTFTCPSNIASPQHDEILYINQAEYGHLDPVHIAEYPKLRYLQTDGLSYCAWLAMYDSKTGMYWLGHFDDGLNIPASIYDIRQKFDKFFLYIWMDDDLWEHISSEIKKRKWHILRTMSNDYISNLQLDTKNGSVYLTQAISDHSRRQRISDQEILPLTMRMSALPTILPVDQNKVHINFDVLYNNHAQKMRTDADNPEWVRIYMEGLDT